MLKEKIIDFLKEHDNQVHVETFANYCKKLKGEVHKSGANKGQLKNPWFQKKTEDYMASLFRKVDQEGLVFDGVNTILTSTGISHNFKQYRNKMLRVYPESKIDIQLVYDGDNFSFRKESGKVVYQHSFSDPFNNTDNRIVGGYCVIKNNRGEFLTTLTKDDFEKHRKVAKTDYIWKAWYPEMCKKTIIKKACSDHFDDLYSGINQQDNENIDLEKSVDIGKTPLMLKQLEVTEALDLYQGDDKAEIQQMCSSKAIAGEFTIEFGDQILASLK